MAEQLTLLDDERNMLPLDERTREIGRRGVADARRALLDTLKAASERPADAA